jgi:hypothetical protein
MAFDDIHKKCMIATLATVEASNDYSIISAPDTLSLGIGQWTQGRAYDLLSRFSGVSFGATVDGWMAEGRDSWTIGSRKYQYLSGADRSALSDALDSEQGHRIQNSQMLADLENEYIPRCQELGMDPEGETEACMLLIVVMHRWGNYASILGRLAQGAGTPATLDSMAAAIKYEGEWWAVGQRYEVAYRMIANLETNGVELSPGESGTDMSKSAGKDAGKVSKKIKYVKRDGSGALSIYLVDGTIARAMPSGDGYWVASKESQKDGKKGGSGGSGSGGGGGGGGGDLHALTELAINSIGKFEYHQWYEARLHPDQTGVTDCSGFVWWLYNTCLGMDIGAGGTAEMIDSYGWVVAEGGGAFDAYDQIREGDLIVCRWYSGGGHVEYCTGGENGETIGARGPDGHSEPHWGNASMFSGCYWKLKRYV